MDISSLKPEERLILPADFKPDDGGVEGIRRKVLALADMLAGTGVVIKVNSALRACGYGLIKELHDRGVRVMADLKLIDIPVTMEIDAFAIADFCPEMLTVMCCAGVEGMSRVRQVLGMTEVLGVTVLTSLNDEECQDLFGCSCSSGVLRFARMAQLAKIGGLVCSPLEAEMLTTITKKMDFSLSLNTPGVRPTWSLVESDDQSRVMTPTQAIANGATRIVVGRPILGAKLNDQGLPQNPREAVERTIVEIVDGLALRQSAQ